MVDFNAIMKAITTVLTFVEGVVAQVAPVVNKFLDRRSPQPTQPLVNPNCQPPHCGIAPNYCPNDQLSSACRQRNLAIDADVHRRPTTAPLETDSDHNQSTEKAPQAMSPGSTVILVLVGVIGLAIVGFLCMRCRHRSEDAWNYDGRKSSQPSVVCERRRHSRSASSMQRGHEAYGSRLSSSLRPVERRLLLGDAQSRNT